MPFWTPTPEQISALSSPNWCASYSGGKDSTCLVTWIEWLRRAGLVDVPSPSLVMSDTGVEDPGLHGISEAMMQLLRSCGWTCVVVEPAIHERLYNRILGIGNIPIHPGFRSLRWCSRSTKIDPMNRWRKDHANGLVLTGLRLGESKIRDGKIKRAGCAAGGECGIPDDDPGRTYSPLLNWSTCNVLDWLEGGCSREVSESIADILPLARQLVSIYRVQIDRNTFDGFDPAVSMARFGCIGCPAIAVGSDAPKSVVARYGVDSPLCELYSVWEEARRDEGRLWSPRLSKCLGPIKLEVRKVLFEKVMDIQRRAGVVLIRPEDEEFIRKCWAEKRYPRGWSEADESVSPPELPLFG